MEFALKTTRNNLSPVLADYLCFSNMKPRLRKVDLMVSMWEEVLRQVLHGLSIVYRQEPVIVV